MNTRQTSQQTVSSRQEPLAIVGMACRLPGGVRSPEEFWRLLAEGVDAVRQVPAERWSLDVWYDADPEVPGKTYSRHGGFLAEVDEFDASFFGISAPEARSMDPQQRLLLELAWEALEDAGVVAERLQGTPTGVFLGMCLSDYAQLELNAPDPSGINPYSGSGGVLSMAAGRIASTLGLEGPALVVDTSCSSSLVATHLACQSLRDGECDVALVGGANLLLSPRMTVYFSKLKALSPDGACKAFDRSANGYVRGEGAGVLVLKRLSDALAAGDSIVAVVRGSAVNQEGRTNRLTAPHQAAQERVIERALGQGGIAPHEVGYVEAHGVGSPLGDSVEVKALAAVLGRQRPASAPVGIGSVKTNLGHLEGAAGIASLLKVALALRHRALPRSLHFKEPSPHIPWAELPVEVISEHRPWSVASGQRRIAGVSALGLSGTNAHVVLEEAPEPTHRPVVPSPAERTELLVLSARTPRALHEAALRFSARLSSSEAESGASPHALSYSSTCHRSHHEHRLAVAARSQRDAVGALEAFQRGLAHPDLQSGSVRPGPAPRVVFLFTGQGGHWPGTGRALLEQEPVFRDAVSAADAVYQRLSGWSLIEEWRRDKPRFDQAAFSQPAHVALQMGLAALLRSWGIVPDAIVGSSIGEAASAYAAGVLSLEDAMLVTQASGALHTDIGEGAMCAAELSEEEAREVIAPYGGRLSIAAINSPASTLLSGEAGAMDALLRELTARGISARQMGINYASHSPAVEPRQAALRRALGSLRLNPPVLPLYTTVTGERARPGDFDAEHWARNYRQPVRFAPVISTLAEQGFTLFIELGPNAVLARPVQQCFQKLGKSATVLSTLRRGEPERHTLRTLVGGFYVAGGVPAWERLFPEGGERVPLPSYPWQKERYWVAAGSVALHPVHVAPALAAHDDAPGSLLAERLQSLPAASPLGTVDAVPDARVLAGMPPEERLARVESFLRGEVAWLLELTQDLSDWSLPLVRFGFDSLMSMKLKARLEQTLGIAVSTARLLSGLCLPDLVTLVVEQLAMLPPETALDDQMEEFQF